jgi:hypothetical protein
MTDHNAIFGPSDDGQPRRRPVPLPDGATQESTLADPSAAPKVDEALAETEALRVAEEARARGAGNDHLIGQLLARGRPVWVLLNDGQVLPLPVRAALPAGAKYACNEGDSDWLALPVPLPLPAKGKRRRRKRGRP